MKRPLALFSPLDRAFLILTLVGCGVVVLGRYLPVLSAIAGLGVMITLSLSLIWCTRLAIAIVLRIRDRHGEERREPRAFRHRARVPLIIGFMLLLVFTYMPLYVAFFISKPSMNALADQVMVQMPAPHCPGDRWVGVLDAQDISRCGHGFRFDVPYFRIWDMAGFAYSTQGPPPDVGNGDTYVQFWGRWYTWRPPRRW